MPLPHVEIENKDAANTEFRRSFVARIWMAVGITGLVVILSAVLWFGKEIFLLAFAGVLVAVLLRSLADFLSGRTGLSSGWSLGIVVATLFVVCGASGAWLAPRVANQSTQLMEELPRAAERLQAVEGANHWTTKALSNAVSAEGWIAQSGSSLSYKLLGAVSTTLDVVGGLLVCLIVGLFLAMEPQTYSEGVVRLVPPAGRERTRALLDELGHTLRWWLIGRGIAMLFVGTTTALGLWWLGIPFALPLAILTTLLGFVPYFGPILAVIPAALLGLVDSPGKAAAVAGLYLVVQVAEGNVLTPLVQRGVVSVPPAVTIVSLLTIGVLLGPLGMVLAMPLTAVGFVLVKRLYLEDALGDSN